MHNSGVRGVWQSALPRILHLSDRLYCIQTSEVKGIGLMPLCVFTSFFFPFLQVYRDSNEGERFIQFYHVTSYPYLAVLDPRTGVTKFARNR